MLKEEIKRLGMSVYLLAERNEANLLSYWSGYFERRDDIETKFIKFIGNYLKHKYGIENHFSNWIELIDHYSFIKKVDWFNGFYKLLNELNNYEGEEIKDINVVNNINLIEVEKSDEILDKIVSKEGIKIKKGQIIKLSDKIGVDFKTTKYYDVNIKNPSYDLFFPSEKDFKFIRFFHKNETKKITYGKVWRIFSGFPTVVKSIEKRKGKYYIYTDIFEIELHGALKENEFFISSEESIPNNFSHIIENLNSRIEFLSLEMILKSEFNLGNFILERFYLFNFDWQNYGRHFSTNIGRNWTKVIR